MSSGQVYLLSNLSQDLALSFYITRRGYKDPNVLEYFHQLSSSSVALGTATTLSPFNNIPIIIGRQEIVPLQE